MIASELESLLRKYNRGVAKVVVEYGIVCVYTKSQKSTIGVTIDLLRSRAFRSVKSTANNIDGGFIVHAVPM